MTLHCWESMLQVQTRSAISELSECSDLSVSSLNSLNSRTLQLSQPSILITLHCWELKLCVQAHVTISELSLCAQISELSFSLSHLFLMFCQHHLDNSFIDYLCSQSLDDSSLLRVDVTVTKSTNRRNNLLALRMFWALCQFFRLSQLSNVTALWTFYLDHSSLLRVEVTCTNTRNNLWGIFCAQLSELSLSLLFLVNSILITLVLITFCELNLDDSSLLRVEATSTNTRNNLWALWLPRALSVLSTWQRRLAWQPWILCRRN